MKDELILDFQRRLSQCNKGEMIVIMYDIVFAYMKEAKEEKLFGSYENYKQAIHRAVAGVDALIGALDFSYPIAKELYRLYILAKQYLAKGIYQNRIEGIEEAERLLLPVYEAFKELAKADKSAPLMGNAQNVYAGMTYGKTSLNENLTGEANRGFWA